MAENLGRHYHQRFFSRHVEGMSKSGEVVLGLLFEHYEPESVVDFGCGQGAWLAAAEGHGATTLRGLDGDWVRPDSLLSPNIEFFPVDFDHEMPELDRRFDLAIALEVAEHLRPADAGRFVGTLCAASNVVLFGAAIPFQGGTNHLNERDQSYWIERFLEQGYQCVDLIRPRVWHDDAVAWWYRQNSFLFVGPESDLDLAALRRLEAPIHDAVHPLNYQRWARMVERPTLAFWWKCSRRWLRGWFRKSPT